jgi:hypothetical protein
MMTILPQLEKDLRHAAERTLGRDAVRSRRRHGVSLSWVPVLACVLVTVAVAAVALISLHSNGEQSTTPGSVAGKTRLSAPLIAQLALLRRPQTPADVQPELLPGFLGIGFAAPVRPGHEQYRCAGQQVIATPPARKVHPPAASLRHEEYPQIECQLMRVVEIPQWHARVVVAPETFRPNPRSPGRSQGMNLALDDPVGGMTGTTGTGARASGVGPVLHGGLTVFEKGGNDTTHGIILVPDGVAKVILDNIRLMPKGSPATVATQTREVLAQARLAAPVHSNIAAFSFPTPMVTTKSSPFPRAGTAFERGPIGINATGRETWLNAAGSVIRRSRVPLDLLLQFRIT